MPQGRQVSPGAQLSRLWYNACPQFKRAQEDTETLPLSCAKDKKQYKIYIKDEKNVSLKTQI